MDVGFEDLSQALEAEAFFPKSLDLPVTPQSFTVTYTKPGTFKYQCIFHDDDGMKGTLVVQPK